MKGKVKEVGRNWIVLEVEGKEIKRSIKASDAEKIKKEGISEIEFEEKEGLVIPKWS